jgi:hypothetical protein
MIILNLTLEEDNIRNLLAAKEIIDSAISSFIEESSSYHMRPVIHPVQIKILELAHKEDISKMTLRKIGIKVGVEHPQKIKHHINRLIKLNLLKEHFTPKGERKDI